MAAPSLRRERAESSRVECLASYLGYLGSVPRISYSRHNDVLQIGASFASLDHGSYIMPLISYLASVSKFSPRLVSCVGI